MLSIAHDGKVFTHGRWEAAGREWLSFSQTLQIRALVQSKAASPSYQNLAAVRHPEQGAPSESHCWSQCILKSCRMKSPVVLQAIVPLQRLQVLSPPRVTVQGNTAVAQLSILMQILPVYVFFAPSELEVLWHISIATHLTYGQTTDLCLLAKVRHPVPCTLVQFRYPPLAQMPDTWDTARKPLKLFTWKHGGYLDTELLLHNLEQHNSRENPSCRTAGKKVWFNQPQTHPVQGTGQLFNRIS